MAERLFPQQEIRVQIPVGPVVCFSIYLQLFNSTYITTP